MNRVQLTSRARLVPALLAVATLAGYWPVLHNNFTLYDDPQYVTNNLHVLRGLTWPNIVWAFSATDANNWHPVTWLSHLMDVTLFGLRPGWHHFVSLLLHLANTLLLFRFLERLTRACWRSAAVAALFAVHPLHVESVAWAAERKDLLSLFFFLLTLMAYARYVAASRGVEQPAQSSACAGERVPGGDTQSGTRGQPQSEPPVACSHRQSPLYNLRLRRPAKGSRYYYLLALLLFALGLMSKPMLVTLPLVLLLLDCWPLGRLGFGLARDAAEGTPPGLAAARPQIAQHEAWLRLLVEKVPFLVLAFASCLMTLLVQEQGHATTSVLPLGPRLANAVASYWKYLGKTVWPADLAVFYPHPDTRYPFSHQWPLWAILGAAVLLGLVSLYVFRRRWRAPWLALGWFWYLVTLLPVIGIVQVGGQAMADRYTYLPLVGIFIALVWELDALLGRWPDGRAALAASGALAGLTCVALTHQQAEYWKDDFTLFSHALAVTQDNASAQFHVGTALRLQGKPVEAAQHFQAAIKAAPAMADGYYGLALCLDPKEKPQEVLGLFTNALAAASWDAHLHHGLGTALWVMGRRDEAQAQYLEALRLKPAFPEALIHLGMARAALGDLPGAEARFKEVLHLNPRSTAALSHLAETLFKQGRLMDAEAAYQQWVRCEPTNAEARINLGSLLWHRGHSAEALTQATEAARLAPTLPLARFNLGTMLSAQARFGEAAREFAAAAWLRPDYLEAWTALGRALAGQGRYGQAAAAFHQSTQLCPTNPELQLFLASALRLDGKTNEAVTAFSTALRQDPELPTKLAHLAAKLAAQGQLAAAAANLDTTLCLKPDDVMAHEELARLLRQQGKTNEAERHERAAARLRERQPK